MAAAEPRLRRARREDLAALLQLEALFPGDRLSRAGWLRFLRSAGAEIWVAEAGERLLGNLLLLFRRGNAGARIYSLIVDPAARGQGLARALVAQAERSARARGCTYMSLEVRADNRAARQLYAGLGYRRHAALPGYYEDGGDGERLRKPL
ncbi:MAG TPA: GNAT family N-acetyltransferase [Nevskiaceae bacterium]|nr:GNAT family N-acetyltransferase [Nevskiaceae bacterium]